MTKKLKYISFIFFVFSLNVYAYVAYPNMIHAENNDSQKVDIRVDDKISQFIILTDYLFINTPNEGEKINPNLTYEIDCNNEYEVVEVIDGLSGLDAFILKTENNKYILSIRGTEGYELDGDLTVDTKLMLNENQQYEELISKLTDSEYETKIDYVIGHSLGGSIALNISMWMLNHGHELEKVYVFSPAPIVKDDNVTDITVSALNKILTLVVYDNEILYNFGNYVIGLTDLIKAYDPYKIFPHYVISVDNDVNNGFTNHFISQMIPIVKGVLPATYKILEYR